MYDAAARALAVKVIGTVESGLDYTAVNYDDPITVGIAQWYGTRAANVLCRMRDENPSAWSGVAPSLVSHLATMDKNNGYWNSRYLTRAEGESLAGVMSNNKEIQNKQLGDDLEPYKQTAASYGFNPDTNTKTVIYFFSMHHQSPKSALEVVLTLDTEATLTQIHAATLAHPILGQYVNRYTDTYNMVNEWTPGTTPPGTETPPAETPAENPNQISYITGAGDSLHLKYKDGHLATFLPNGRGYWLPGKDVQPEPEPETPTDPGTPPVTPPANGSWVHPLPNSSLTSPYGPRGFDGVGNYHYGTDFSTGRNAPVLAPADLIITISSEDGAGGSWSAGSYVKGHTTDGAYTMNFYHMVAGSLRVRAGDRIARGTQIGLEGETGNAFGAHLHFEMYAGIHNDPWPPPYGDTINPEPILRAKGVNF